MLEKLLSPFRTNDGSYDVIVPVVERQVPLLHIFLKNKYGVNPLTVTWAPSLHRHWMEKYEVDAYRGLDNILYSALII